MIEIQVASTENSEENPSSTWDMNPQSSVIKPDTPTTEPLETLR